MAGVSGPAPAAIGVDPGDHILDRGLHDRHPRLPFDGLFAAIMLNEGDLSHSGPFSRVFLAGASLRDHTREHKELASRRSHAMSACPNGLPHFSLSTLK